MKKWEKMEALQLEFEVSTKPGVEVCRDELEQKHEHMAKFKKVWGKFALATDMYLKRSEYLHGLNFRGRSLQL